jgi:hypothetical protein
VAEVSATALRAALDEAKRLRGSGEPRPFGSLIQNLFLSV